MENSIVWCMPVVLAAGEAEAKESLGSLGRQRCY